MDSIEHLETNQPLVLCLNALLCLAMMGICICISQLDAMDRHVLMRVRLEYVLCMATGFISTARPWWGENVGSASLMLKTTSLMIFFSSSHAWRAVRTRDGPNDTAPDSAKTDNAPLEMPR